MGGCAGSCLASATTASGPCRAERSPADSREGVAARRGWGVGTGRCRAWSPSSRPSPRRSGHRHSPQTIRGAPPQRPRTQGVRLQWVWSPLAQPSRYHRRPRDSTQEWPWGPAMWTEASGRRSSAPDPHLGAPPQTQIQPRVQHRAALHPELPLSAAVEFPAAVPERVDRSVTILSHLQFFFLVFRRSPVLLWHRPHSAMVPMASFPAASTIPAATHRSCPACIPASGPPHRSNAPPVRSPPCK